MMPRLARALCWAAATAAVLAAATLLPQRTALQALQIDLAAGLRAHLFARPPEAAAVAVVGVDARSLEAPPLAGRPRALLSPVWAEFAALALRHGARAVALDFVLAFDAAEMAEGFERHDDALLRALLQHGRAGRLVIGRGRSAVPARRFRAAAGARGVGVIEVPLGPDGAVRRLPPSLPLAEGGAAMTLSGRLRESLGLQTETETLLVPPRPLDSLPSASLIDLLACEDDAALDAFFGGRAILVGTAVRGEDLLGGADRFYPARPPAAAPEGDCPLPPLAARAPGERAMPAVFLHAAAVDGVASGWAPAPLGRGPTLALLLLAAALPAAAALYRSRLTAAAAMAGAMGGGLLAGALLLEWTGLLLASGATLWAPPVAAALAFTLRLGVLERDARSLRRRFEHYLAPVLIERMVAEGEMPRLGGAPCEATVMFADLSGFTALSETVESDRLMSLLNRYLDLMSTVIRDHDGYVDKFIGDAVMAIWNAPAPIPDHARAAVQAALAIEAAVRAQAEADAAAGLPGFRVKIGINSGSVSAGNIGARHRLNYSVVGETVNVAARLESLPGVFATPVILGEGTVRAMGAGAGSEVLRLARIRVKGRAAPLSIYAPLTPEEATWSHARRYAEALAAYEEGRFSLAAAGWDALQVTDWRGAGPARLMACDAHRRAKAPAAEREGVRPNDAAPKGVFGPGESGPGGAWDGVLAFTSK